MKTLSVKVVVVAVALFGLRFESICHMCFNRLSSDSDLNFIADFALALPEYDIGPARQGQ